MATIARPIIRDPIRRPNSLPRLKTTQSDLGAFSPPSKDLGGGMERSAFAGGGGLAQHDDLGANSRALIEVDDVLVDHTNTA